MGGLIRCLAESFRPHVHCTDQRLPPMNQPLTLTAAQKAGPKLTVVALGVVLAILVALPLLHLLPADHALHVSAYTLTLVGKILCYAIVALALDLVWGYAGLLSLGHGLFFALGGYAMGM